MKHIISTALSSLLIASASFTSAIHAHPSWKGDAKGGKDVSALAEAKKKIKANGKKPTKAAMRSERKVD